jgi:glycosyltransferase involved in cell wall biosynthesis
MKLSLIIPAKDESLRVVTPIVDFYNSLSDVLKDDFEIIVVINNTSDNTKTKLTELKNSKSLSNLFIYDIGHAKGKGDAVFWGINKAKGEIIGYIDADGSSPGSELVRLLTYLDSHKDYDGVIASRYLKGSKIIGKQPFLRTILSRLFNIATNLLFSIPFRDTQCGLKLFRSKVIKDVDSQIIVYGWTFDVNILVALQNMDVKIKEVPSTWYFREGSHLDIRKTTVTVVSEFSRIFRYFLNGDTFRSFFMKQQLLQIGAGLLLVLLFALWNSYPGSILFGLDNISPYWGIDKVIARINDSYTGFQDAPILFSPIIGISSLLGFNASLTSHLSLWGSLLFGSLGILILIKRFFIAHSYNLPRFWSIISVLLVLASLVTIWMVSHNEFLYLSAFAGLPWVILYLSDETLSLSHRYMRVIVSIAFYFIGILLFFVSALNIVAFSLFIVQASIIALFMTKSPKYFQILSRTILLMIFFSLGLQAIFIISGRETNIVHDIINHISLLQSHPYTQDITTDLRSAEQVTNSVSNVIRFATGWLLMNDLSFEKVFSHTAYYKDNIFVAIIGIIPLGIPGMLFLHRWVTNKTQPKAITFLFVIALMTVFGLSMYSSEILSGIPIVRDALRFGSSKFWPLLLYPSIIIPLFIFGQKEFPQTFRVGYLLALVTFIGVYIIPWSTKTILSSRIINTIPQEYEILTTLETTGKIFIYPAPQRLYFRQYNWGYYGSDFLRYYTSRSILDIAEINNKQREYNDIVSKLQHCEMELDIPKDLTILYDTSLTTVENTYGKMQVTRCLSTRFTPIYTSESFTLYR